MRNRKTLFKDIVAAAACLLVVSGVVLMSGEKASAVTEVAIDETNFPSKDLREYLMDTYDIYDTHFGYLSEEELSYATSISLIEKDVKTLKGIELLPNLDYIYIENCGLGEADLTHNPKLNNVYLEKNNLSSINVKYNPELANLFISGNKIKNLDLSQNPDLLRLGFEDTLIESIDLSKNKELTEIRCDKNPQLKSMDLSANDKLTMFSCTDSRLINLKFGNPKDLIYLFLENDNLTSLDLSKMTSLEQLYCCKNKLSSLNVSNCSKLRFFSCWKNQLTKIDVGGLTDLELLNCEDNEITSLSLINLAKLREVDCRYNKLSELNLSNCPSLESLECNSNQIGALNLLQCYNLYYLTCEQNNIKKIDISASSKLLKVYNEGNKEEYSTYYEITYDEYPDSYYLRYDRSVKVITSTMIEPTDTPTPTPTPATDITDDYSTATVAVGKTIKLDSSVLGSKPYTWSSSDKSIATVDSDGYVTGKKVGTCTITVTKGEKKLICTLTVTAAAPTPTGSAKPTGSANPNPTNAPADDKNTTTAEAAIPVVCGKSISINPAIVIGNGTYTWQSSDTKVATVDSKGVVTGKMAGMVNIVVKNGKKTLIQPVTVLYKDVTSKKDFWYAPTNYLTAKGVVKGYDKQTKFKPANKCTRAQMVTFIWRLQGEPAPKAKTCKFKDVKKSDYFYKACIWGNENHIVEGYKNGTFGPQIVCARKHAVTFLWRLAGQPKPSSTKNKFKDVKEKDYYYKATLWASEKGILAGYSDGTFKPNGDCLRRQMVTFLYKYDKFINGKG